MLNFCLTINRPTITTPLFLCLQIDEIKTVLTQTFLKLELWNFAWVLFIEAELLYLPYKLIKTKTLWRKWPPESRYNWLPILQHSSQKLALVVIVSPLDFLFFRDGNIDIELGRFLIHITGITVRCVTSPPCGLGTCLAPVVWLVYLCWFLNIHWAPAGGCCRFGSSMETLTLATVCCQAKTTCTAAAHLKPFVGLGAGVAPVVVV